VKIAIMNQIFIVLGLTGGIAYLLAGIFGAIGTIIQRRSNDSWHNFMKSKLEELEKELDPDNKTEVSLDTADLEEGKLLFDFPKKEAQKDWWKRMEEKYGLEEKVCEVNWDTGMLKGIKKDLGVVAK